MRFGGASKFFRSWANSEPFKSWRCITMHADACAHMQVLLLVSYQENLFGWSRDIETCELVATIQYALRYLRLHRRRGGTHG